MTAEQKSRWLAALRSGKYAQGRRKLAHLDTYCCLGVAMCEFHLPRLAAVELLTPTFLPDDQQMALAALNDGSGWPSTTTLSQPVRELMPPDRNIYVSWDFSQIADYIEEHILPTAA